MTNIFLLFLCLVIGFLLQRVKELPANSSIALNTLVLYIPLPAMVLLTVPNLKWQLDLLSLVLVPWINIGAAYFFFRFLGRILGWDPTIVGCLVLTAGHGNTAFVGFPVIEALYGLEALKYAVFLDQLGSFLIVSTIGVSLAAVYSHGRIGKRRLAKKLLVFPPFFAFVIALFLGQLGWQAEGELKEVLSRLAALLTPLALVSVGLQLKWREIRHEYRYLSLALFFKLLLLPGLIFLIYSLFKVPPEIFRVAVMESAMAPMVTAAILAVSSNLHPRLASMMIGVGVPVSFLTLWLWYLVLP